MQAFMTDAIILQQLLQVHYAVERWNHCKSDLWAGIRALTDAALRLRRCLDGWSREPTASAAQASGKGATLSGHSWPAPSNNPTGAVESGQPGALPAAAVAAADGHRDGEAQSGRARELLALTCQEVAQAQYRHALALCAAGYGASADPWVAGLGYRLRLSDQVWAACASSVGRPTDGHNIPASSVSGSAAAGCSSGALLAAPPVVCDDALPGGLLERLAAAFDPAGATPYWRQHRYGRRQTPFFSYLYRLDRAPSSVVEEAIQCLHRRLMQQATSAAEERQGAGERRDAEASGAEPGGEGKGEHAPSLAAGAAAEVAAALRGAAVAEWWAHTRDPAAAHQLHFDVNEDVLRRGLDCYRLTHPTYSSVLFLPPAAPQVAACASAVDAAAAAAATAAAARTAVVSPSSQATASGLSGDDAGELLRRCPGGPTLVLDQTPAGARTGALGSGPSTDRPPPSPAAGGPPLAQRAWPVGPWPNWLLLFPGNLLHGVMPEPPTNRHQPPPPPLPPRSPGGSQPEPEQQQRQQQRQRQQPNDAGPGVSGAVDSRRTTLIVAWWGSERLRTATAAPPLVLSCSDPAAGGRAKRRRDGRSAAVALGARGKVAGGLRVQKRQRGQDGQGAEAAAEGSAQRRQEGGAVSGVPSSSDDSSSSSSSEEGTITTSSSGGDQASDSSDEGEVSSRSTLSSASGPSDSRSSEGEEMDPAADADAPGGVRRGGAEGDGAGRSRPRRLDWRHAASLRPGMLLPVPRAWPGPEGLAAAAAPVAVAPLPQSLGAVERSLKGAGGVDHASCGEAAAAAAAAGSLYENGPVPQRLAAPPTPPGRPLTWLEWFAALRGGKTLVSEPEGTAQPGDGSAAARMGPVAARPVGEEDEVTAPPLQWLEPACVSPAWVRVERPRRGASPQAQGAATPAIDVPAAGASSEQPGVAPGTRAHQPQQPPCEWDAARQAVRGMAVALGLAPEALSLASWGPEGVVEQPSGPLGQGAQPHLERQEMGHPRQQPEQHRESEPEPSAALRCVMGALQLPDLRVFLTHPLELAELYLPPPPPPPYPPPPRGGNPND